MGILTAADMQIFPGKCLILTVQLCVPADCRVIVMCPCIYDTVLVIIVRQIITLFSGVKSKLQNLHTRIAGLLHKFDDRVGQKSKILRDHGLIPQLRLHRLEDIVTGTLLPVSELRRRIAVRNRIIFIETAEMIDPHYII